MTASTPDKPVDSRRLVLPIANVAAIVLSVCGASFWAVSTLTREAQSVGSRVTRVEFSIEGLAKEFASLTRAVDVGVSTVQFDSWIKLLRANLSALDVQSDDPGRRAMLADLKRALKDAVPNPPARER